jgi:predicted nucleic acid-binding Zn ribbon protein
MSRYNDGPRALGESLRALASRYKKVDLFVIDEIRDRWELIVGEALAARCRPLLVRDGLLVVEVPSGAFAERLRSEESNIVAALSELGDRAPKGLRITVKSS